MSDEAMVQISLRITQELCERIEAEVEERKAEKPGRTINRSDVVRELVHEGLDRKRKKSDSRRKKR